MTIKKGVRQVHKSRCTRCRWYRERRRLSFSCINRWGTFDVEAAEKIVSDGRPVRVMSLRSLKRFSERDGWQKDPTIIKSHVPHVSGRKPMIFGTLSDAVDGVRVFLIEGHHRGLGHVWDERDAPYYLLSREETERITLRRRNRKMRGGRRGVAATKARRSGRASMRSHRATRQRDGGASASPAPCNQ